MALNKKELMEVVAAMKEQAELQESLNNSLGGYLSGLKKIKKINEEISLNKKLQSEIETKMLSMNSGPAKDEEQQKLDYLKKQTGELEKQGKQLTNNLKAVNKTNLLMGESVKGLVKGFASFPKMVEKGYGKIKSLGLFDMDKAIKQSSLSMGILSTQSNAFRTDIMAAARDTLEIGIGVAELAKIQSEYSENVGRAVMLNKEGLKAISDIAVATGLGVEGASKMAADFERQGLSAEKTAEFINQSMTDSTKMGLNASKVIKNIQSNIKLLNKYNFKDGIKGLKEMSQIVTKLGVDMTFATGMADKLFDIEGAVEMSSQLQVMGGAWSKLADPFHLMYMARNDMAGLTEEIGKAAESSVNFNKKSGDFEISAMEMHRLRKIAEQTGISYEELAEAGKNARKQTEIGRQIRFNVDNETKEFLKNSSKFNDKGEAYIEIKGEKRLLKTLNETDRSFLKNQLLEKQKLNERAKSARTFDEALVNLINQFKTSLLPLVDVMSIKLIPKIDKFVERIKDNGWLDKISYFGKKIGDLISFFGGWILENPIKAGFVYGSMKLTNFLIDKALWVGNGLLLAKGFNMGVNSKGSIIDNLPGGKGGKGGKTTKFGKLGKFTKFGSLLAGGLSAWDEFDEQRENGKSKEDAFGRAALKGAGAGLGAWGGASAGAALGALGGPLAPITVPLGALIGSIAGAWGGGELLDLDNYGVEDGLFHGSDKNRRAILQNGRITPIDNKDDLLALKKDGVISKSLVDNSSTSKMKHEFGDININGEIMLMTPGGEKVSTDILKDPQLIRQLTRMIHAETQKVINGGKTR